MKWKSLILAVAMGFIVMVGFFNVAYRIPELIAIPESEWLQHPVLLLTIFTGYVFWGFVSWLVYNKDVNVGKND